MPNLPQSADLAQYPPVDPTTLTFDDLCPCQQDLVRRMDSIVDQVALVAWLATDGDIPRALEVTPDTWDAIRLRYLPTFTLTPDVLTQLTSCGWADTLSIGFMPSEPRGRALLLSSAIQYPTPTSNDTHWTAECQYTAPGASLDSLLLQFDLRRRQAAMSSVVDATAQQKT
jgi:hypothetical protein